MSEEHDIKTPSNMSDVSISTSNSRPSTAAHSEPDAGNKGVNNEKDIKEKTDKKAEVVQDPYYKAMDYLEEHNIIQFFQKLTAAIIFERPADPVQFIVDKAEEVAESLNDDELKKFYGKKT